MEAVDHKVMIQDLLDLPDPALRVLFWPRPGAMRATQDRISATLELVVSNDEPELREVVARYWVGDPPVDEASLGSIPVDTLDLAWVRGRMLDFIEAILAQA